MVEFHITKVFFPKKPKLNTKKRNFISNSEFKTKPSFHGKNLSEVDFKDRSLRLIYGSSIKNILEVKPIILKMNQLFIK